VPTIGVSIAVPEPWGSELQAFRASVGDTSAEGIPTHITLMPPHEIDEQLDHAFRTLSAFECAFDVDRFSLYVHAPADGWMPTCDFPLTAGAEG
jgi:hypothetical protein